MCRVPLGPFSRFCLNELGFARTAGLHRHLWAAQGSLPGAMVEEFADTGSTEGQVATAKVATRRCRERQASATYQRQMSRKPASMHRRGGDRPRRLKLPTYEGELMKFSQGL